MSSHTPLIEVVLPARNAQATIGEAVASILTQTHQHFSLVIIDDASEDATPQLLASCTDPRVQVIRNEQPQGIGASINARIVDSTAAFLAVMHGDDVAMPLRLEAQCRFLLAHPEITVLGTAIELFQDWQGVRYFPQADERIRCALLFDAAFAHSTVVLRRASLLQHSLRYRSDLLGVEDYQLWCSIPRSCKMANLPTVAMRYRVHATQLSAVAGTTLAENADRVREAQLSAFDHAFSDEERATHAQIARLAFTPTTDFLEYAHSWLLQLLQANAAQRIYDQDTFAAELESRWWDVCQRSATLGPVCIDHYCASPLARRHRRSTQDVAALMRLCTR